MVKRSKTLNVNLDLTAFISLLSVCICFLLLTAVWVQVGSLNFEQSLQGQNSQAQLERAVWVRILNANHITLRLKNVNLNNKKKIVISSQFEQINKKEFIKHLQEIKKRFPQMSRAFILPDAKASYQSLVQVMDFLKQTGFYNLGVSPL